MKNKQGFLIDKSTFDLVPFDVTKVNNGRVYFLDFQGKEKWNKQETETHIWIVDTKEFAKSVLKTMIKSKILKCEATIDFCKSKLELI